MKRYRSLPIFLLFGAAVLFILRLLQVQTGFEPDTGLAIPGNLWGIATPVALALLAAGALALSRLLPQEALPEVSDPAETPPPGESAGLPAEDASLQEAAGSAAPLSPEGFSTPEEAPSPEEPVASVPPLDGAAPESAVPAADSGQTACLPFSAFFGTQRVGLLMLPVAGLFLMALSGLLELAGGLGLSLPISGALAPSALTLSAPSPQEQVICGVLSLLCAGSLFPAVWSCRLAGSREADPAPPRSFHTALLLVPVAALVIRLVLIYRLESVNPSLSAYYLELLALIGMTLGFYRLSSFAFQVGQSRRFGLYAMLAVFCCAGAMADGRSPASLLLFAGGAMTLLGFLLLRLENLAAPRRNC